MHRDLGRARILVGWPRSDNEPAVAVLDWMTGDRNAKYFVTQLLAGTVGAAVEKSLFSHAIGVADNDTLSSSDALYVLPFSIHRDWILWEAVGEQESS